MVKAKKRGSLTYNTKISSTFPSYNSYQNIMIHELASFEFQIHFVFTSNLSSFYHLDRLENCAWPILKIYIGRNRVSVMETTKLN